MTLDQLFKAVADGLEVDLADISMESSSENTEGWDSLGHILIMSNLNDLTDGKTADLVDLTQAASVKEMADILLAEGILQPA